MEESKKEKELENISSDIDGVVVNIFTTLRDLFTARNQLENVMKDGYLNMAKARYEMGHGSTVGKLQYCEQDLTSALYHISVSESSAESANDESTDGKKDSTVCTSLQFLPLKVDDSPVSQSSSASSSDQQNKQEVSDSNQKADIEDSPSKGNLVEDIPQKPVDASELGVGLRKRTVAGPTNENDDDKSENRSDGTTPKKHSVNDGNTEVHKVKVDEKVSEDVDIADKTSGISIKDEDDISNDIANKENDSCPSKKENKISEDSKSPRKDPLRWFGVLVPRSLRSSQNSFKRAVEIACTVATLQSQLNAHRTKYVELMKVKAELSQLIDKEGGGAKVEKPSEGEIVTTAA